MDPQHHPILNQEQYNQLVLDLAAHLQQTILANTLVPAAPVHPHMQQSKVHVAKPEFFKGNNWEGFKWQVTIFLLRSCLLTLTQLELIQVIGSLIVFVYN